MSAHILDGAKLAQKRRDTIAQEVEEFTKNGGPTPVIATVLIGEDPASMTYVRSKRKAAAKLGMDSRAIELSADTSQGEVERTIKTLNDDPAVHGILVQLPLPQGLDEEKILRAIDIKKDVDGFHPLNIGRLAQKGRQPLFVPATPKGIMVLIESAGKPIEGAEAVVLGRSNIVGMPTSLLLIRANATITICHSRTVDLAQVCRRADILVAAIGRAEMVRSDWVKPGAVVIDVGINRVEDADAKRGYRLVGDVAYEEVIDVAGAITPVPGGVGPMTIAMLLENTLHAARLQSGQIG